MVNLVSNKKAHFNYEILERYEAGIELLGHEVKAVKAGHVSLEGAHVTVRGMEAYLIGATITPYQPNNTPKSYVPDRNRKLLLNKKQLEALGGNEAKKGLTIVPLSMYNKGPKVKVEIALVRGKKEYDKRESIKKRDTKRDIDRTLKNQ